MVTKLVFRPFCLAHICTLLMEHSPSQVHVVVCAPQLVLPFWDVVKSVGKSQGPAEGRRAQRIIPGSHILSWTTSIPCFLSAITSPSSFSTSSHCHGAQCAHRPTVMEPRAVS